MPHEKSTLEEMISMLKQQRDEINLKIHLAGDEAKEEWKVLRDKYDKLMDDYEPVRKAAGESAGNVYESLKLVAEEVWEGFKRVKKAL